MAVLITAVVAVFLLSDTAGEALELAGEAGEIRLREPIRPIRGEARVVIFALDGVGDEALREALRSERLLHIAALLGGQLEEDVFEHAYAVPDAVSILPSATRAAWTSIFTGRPPAETTGHPMPELQGTLDLIFAREPRPPGEPALPFQTWDGARLVPVGDYLARNPRPDLLRLEERLEGLAAGPYGHRAGDILLLARSGMNRPIADRFYFSHLYNSWHGSPEAQDSKIPILVAHPGSTGRELQRRVRDVVGEAPSQLHIVPLVQALLNRR
ncbi:MAG TPA: hypothetical protein VGR27_07155 [Longimicrobiaceae bacterium]|nr:hypothetical protein [Longimicrobiaceae bacterium]